MTDRELMEAAAVAYWGSEIDDVCAIRWLEEDRAIGYTHGDNQDHNGEDREFVWNPLVDDGDALRLAVALRLEFEWWKNGVAVGRDDMPPPPIEHVGTDPYAATRRAIVRAAAAIGTHKEGA